MLLKRAPDVAHFNIDGLELRVEVERSHAVFSTDAGAFVAAERQLARVDVVVVDVRTTRFQSRHDSVRATQVSADHKHTTTQS